MFSTGSEDYIAPPEAAVALAEEIPPIEITYFPWLTITIAATLIGMFMIMMGVNNCPKHTIPPDVCFPAIFGRFSLQPTDQNPKYGPFRETLIKMGGLYFKQVLHINQAWRLLSNIWLHEGLILLLTDIAILLAVGVPLNRKFRFARVGSLYLISGLGGSLASSLFYESSVTVGASGALVGLAGGTISKVVTCYLLLSRCPSM
ncbi:hypothetical protein TSUD_194800 [Trifolium subterraneum]|nr:hypothetical protein TSUD_194800 [Trifolium subterraneum]